jgi:hypothetical protein
VIEYPLDGTLFPPEISAPTIRWKDANVRATLWLVTIEFPDGQGCINDFAPQSEWRPRPRAWEEVKRRSLEGPVVVTVIGIDRGAPATVLSAGRVTIRASVGQSGSAAVLSGSESPLCGRGQGPLFHSLTFRDRFVRGASARRFGEPVGVRKLSLLLNGWRRAGDGYRLRQ